MAKEPLNKSLKRPQPSTLQLRSAEERRPQAKEAGSLPLAPLWLPVGVVCGCRLWPAPFLLWPCITPPMAAMSHTREPLCIIQDPPSPPLKEPLPPRTSRAQHRTALAESEVNRALEEAVVLRGRAQTLYHGGSCHRGPRQTTP